jgi:hypothetical protein
MLSFVTFPKCDVTVGPCCHLIVRSMCPRHIRVVKKLVRTPVMEVSMVRLMMVSHCVCIHCTRGGRAVNSPTGASQLPGGVQRPAYSHRDIQSISTQQSS